MATRVLYVRLPADLHAEVSRQAEAHDVTLTAFVTRGLTKYLTDHLGYEADEKAALP